MRTGDYDAIDRLNSLKENIRVDSPDYGFLQKAYSQLAEFDEHQRETVDRNNSLNEILKSAQTAQKLYDAVVELARQMNVRVVYEEP